MYVTKRMLAAFFAVSLLAGAVGGSIAGSSFGSAPVQAQGSGCGDVSWNPCYVESVDSSSDCGNVSSNPCYVEQADLPLPCGSRFDPCHVVVD